MDKNEILQMLVEIGGFDINELEKALSQNSGVNIKGYWKVECFDPQGNLKWIEEAHNIVVNVGLNHLLDAVLYAASSFDPWYIGLIDNASAITIAAGDTMASHAGWTENKNYTLENDTDNQRIEYNNAAASSQSTTNSANKAAFKVDTDSQVIAGAFLCNNQDRTQDTGILFCGVEFSGDKNADTDDVLQVTYTISAADDA